MITRRSPLIAALAVIGALALSACGGGSTNSAAASGTPQSITFAILPAENEASTGPLWNPLIQDMERAIGVRVVPRFVSNYTAMVEATRANQVQVGWFSALPALEATNRANADVIGRIVSANGGTNYTSVLIAKRGSGVTLESVLQCGRRYSYGSGDALSTSGTLAPMAYLFVPHNTTPQDCFSVVRSANHQANFFAVANGVVDVASNNSVGLIFMQRQNPELFRNVHVIWESPPLPESSILVRRDLDPALRERIRQFFLTYGTAQGPDGDRQRQVLARLEYGGFRAADNSYLDPVRLMRASNDLATARRGGQPAAIARAQAAYDEVQRDIAAHGTHN